MNEFKNIDKYAYKWISEDDVEESRFFRNLLCRLVDAYKAYPKDLQILSDIEDCFRDFISYEPDNEYELVLGKEFHIIRHIMTLTVIIQFAFLRCFLRTIGRTN